MKTIKYFIIIATIIANHAHATVRILNNNNPNPGQYTSWSAAQTASSNGDTIYVSGSNISYGSIIISKQLTIIGTGYNPQKQNPLVSQFDSVIYNTASFNLNGLSLNILRGIYTSGGVSASIQNCMIAHYCVVAMKSPGTISAWTIRNNVFLMSNNNSFGNSLMITSNESPVNSLTFFQGTIENNIFTGGESINALSGSYADGLGGVYHPGLMKNSVIRNNLFYSSTNVGASIVGTLENTVVQNNIFYNCNAVTVYPASNTNTVSYNCAYPSVTAFSNYNSGNNITADPLFVNAPSYPFQLSYDYHLQASSPCKTTGVNGEEMGVYGGLYGSNFSTYGEPQIPQIKEMNMPATVISGDSFNLNIISKVK